MEKELYEMLLKLHGLFFPSVQYMDRSTYLDLQAKIEDLLERYEKNKQYDPNSR